MDRKSPDVGGWPSSYPLLEEPKKVPKTEPDSDFIADDHPILNADVTRSVQDLDAA